MVIGNIIKKLDKYTWEGKLASRIRTLTNLKTEIGEIYVIERLFNNPKNLRVIYVKDKFAIAPYYSLNLRSYYDLLYRILSGYEPLILTDNKELIKENPKNIIYTPFKYPTNFNELARIIADKIKK